MRWVWLIALLAGMLIAPGGSASAAAAGDSSGFAGRVLELTNSARQDAGLPPLTLSAELNVAAQQYSQVLATTGCFEHTCGPVPDFAERIGQTGYADWSAIGENIAAGYPTPDAVVAGWLSSPGHRANILSAKYTEIGIGVVSGTGPLGTYWTQEFGARPGVELAAKAPPDAPSVDDGAPAAAADGD